MVGRADYICFDYEAWIISVQEYMDQGIPNGPRDNNIAVPAAGLDIATTLKVRSEMDLIQRQGTVSSAFSLCTTSTPRTSPHSLCNAKPSSHTLLDPFVLHNPCPGQYLEKQSKVKVLTSAHSSPSQDNTSPTQTPLPLPLLHPPPLAHSHPFAPAHSLSVSATA